jgi:hypothetical protein
VNWPSEVFGEEEGFKAAHLGCGHKELRDGSRYYEC